MPVLLMLLGNWRLAACGAAALLLALAALRLDAGAYRRGYDTCRAETVADDRARTKDATDADEAARRCAADPLCRMRRDPYRRD